MAMGEHNRESWILLVIALTINALIIYGFFSKPVLKYSISTPLEYNATVNLAEGDLVVTLNVYNIGGSPAEFNFIVRLYNASLTDPQNAEVSVFEEATIVRIPQVGSVPSSGKTSKTIAINAESEASHLILIYSLEAHRNLNPLKGFYNSFVVYESERPTALLLKRMGDLVYKRVTQR
ncbi:MAG: hypothetical protein PVH79_02320 [Candidatus Bathyarchaeota archaeon]|jgi:membrane-associated protease RseP (regulator of RpoE activity)